jgi:hypothetical protein
MSMRAWIVLVALVALVALAGCVHSPYGNFAAQSTPAFNLQLANDTARQVVAVYPPASTALRIDQPATDGYGLALVRALRDAGYAVREFDPRARAAAPANAAADPSLAVHYIVDAPGESNLYRVTLLIGQESLSRGYASQNDRLQALGAWVRKE